MLHLVTLLCLAAMPDTNWPGFRGDGSSQSAARDLPLEWSDDANLAWQRDLTGYGQSSPVAWGGAVFVTSVVGEKKERLVVASYEIKTGQPRWEKQFDATQQIADSDYVSKAAPTPLVDADRLYAFFESGDLVAFDHDGQELWRRKLTAELGEFKGNHGVGSSLAATDEAIFVLVDHDGPSYLLAIDKKTGRDRWKNDRPPLVSWTSPIVTLDGPQTELIVSSNGAVESYSAADGKLRWRLSGLKGNTVPSATVSKSLVLVGSSDVGNNLAVKRDGTGDLKDDKIAWRSKEASATFSSPLVHDGRVYLVNRAGVAFCLNLESGETLWSQRIGGSCWASPLGAGDRVYLFGKDGLTTVVRAGAEFEKLAENKLTVDGKVYGVAALPGAFILRNGKKLICVGKP